MRYPNNCLSQCVSIDALVFCLDTMVHLDNTLGEKKQLIRESSLL